MDLIVRTTTATTATTIKQLFTIKMRAWWLQWAHWVRIERLSAVIENVFNYFFNGKNFSIAVVMVRKMIGTLWNIKKSTLTTIISKVVPGKCNGFAKYHFFGKCFKKNYWIFSQISQFYLKVLSFRLIMENNFIQMAASAGHAVAYMIG